MTSKKSSLPPGVGGPSKYAPIDFVGNVGHSCSIMASSQGQEKSAETNLRQTQNAVLPVEEESKPDTRTI